MQKSSPLQGLAGFLLRRIVFSYWSLPVLAVLSAPVFALLVLWADRVFLTEWLLARDLAPVATADTARDFAGVASGVDAAFVTLYFSITLIVLSLAAGNLGVRLIDRWLEKALVRVSISGLSFSLIVSLVAMLSIDPEADLAATPLGLVYAVFVLQLVNIAMLAVALHDLGRTMFVDTSLARLSRDAKHPPVPICAIAREEVEWHQSYAAPRDGYVEGNNLERIRKILATHPGRVRVCAAPGQHVLEGETLILLETPIDREDEIRDCLPIGPYRSNSQGVVFQVRLMVEIAARALSPAVNDFYTAITAADDLAAAMAHHAPLWIAEDKTAGYEPAPRIELPGQDFRGLFEDPLAAFRQSAADYPPVAIRMIDNYARLCERLADREQHGLVAFLTDRARELRDHAMANAEQECDARAIADAFARLSRTRTNG